jgi:putative ABC transport system permease protein
MRWIRLAIQMLLDVPFKSLGTLIGVFVSAFLMLQELSTLEGILARVSAVPDTADVDLWVASTATESIGATDSVPTSRVGAAASTPGIAWAEPIVLGQGRVTRPDGVRECVSVLGVKAPRYAGLPRRLAPGTARSGLRGSARIFLNDNDRPSFGAAQPGDRIEINGRAGIVSGFFEGMDPHAPCFYVYANIDDARSMTQFPEDRVTFVAIGLMPNARPSDVKQRLAARIPDVKIFTRQDLHDAEVRYFLVRTPAGVFFAVGVAVAALVGGLFVAVTLYSMVLDRLRDYGMLKAIGARNRDLMQILVIQSWAFALVGYILGVACFYAARAGLSSLRMVVTPSILVAVAIASLATCTLASVAAIRRVLTLDAATVFRG